MHSDAARFHENNARMNGEAANYHGRRESFGNPDRDQYGRFAGNGMMGYPGNDRGRMQSGDREETRTGGGSAYADANRDYGLRDDDNRQFQSRDYRDRSAGGDSDNTVEGSYGSQGFSNANNYGRHESSGDRYGRNTRDRDAYGRWDTASGRGGDGRGEYYRYGRN